jgi:hypothetical protein
MDPPRPLSTGYFNRFLAPRLHELIGENHERAYDERIKLEKALAKGQKQMKAGVDVSKSIKKAKNARKEYKSLTNYIKDISKELKYRGEFPMGRTED